MNPNPTDYFDPFEYKKIPVFPTFWKTQIILAKIQKFKTNGGHSIT